MQEYEYLPAPGRARQSSYTRNPPAPRPGGSPPLTGRRRRPRPPPPARAGPGAGRWRWPSPRSRCPRGCPAAAAPSPPAPRSPGGERGGGAGAGTGGSRGRAAPTRAHLPRCRHGGWVLGAGAVLVCIAQPLNLHGTAPAAGRAPPVARGGTVCCGPAIAQRLLRYFTMMCLAPQGVRYRGHPWLILPANFSRPLYFFPAF